ncbi:MAG: hypothetical protein SPL80_00975, partial [Bacilli bacterium]|nr:hypothetical protein [Bacilli bacterium]
QGWLNKGILRSAGVCLGVLVWRDYFTPKRDRASVDMSNRAKICQIFDYALCPRREDNALYLRFCQNGRIVPS